MDQLGQNKRKITAVKFQFNSSSNFIINVRSIGISNKTGMIGMAVNNNGTAPAFVKSKTRFFIYSADFAGISEVIETWNKIGNPLLPASSQNPQQDIGKINLQKIPEEAKQNKVKFWLWLGVDPADLSK